MMNVPDLITLAHKYHAQCSEACFLTWNPDRILTGYWVNFSGQRPSILDAAVMDSAWRVGPSYLEAIKAATGWGLDTIVGFQTVMCLGHPVESSDMGWSRLQHWRGIMMGLLVYEKIKTRYS